MKILKICILALTIGVAGASCKNNENCSTSSTDSSATTVSTVNSKDGTNATANAVVDTANGTGNRSDSTTTAKNGKSSRTEVIYVNGRHKHDTLSSKGPDLKASKKREGNFTSGTGADFPGK